MRSQNNVRPSSKEWGVNLELVNEYFDNGCSGVFLSLPECERKSEADRAKFTETDASSDSNSWLQSSSLFCLSWGCAEKMAQVGRLAEHCCCILGSAAAAAGLLITFCCLILHRPPLQAWIPATATAHLLSPHPPASKLRHSSINRERQR